MDTRIIDALTETQNLFLKETGKRPAELHITSDTYYKLVRECYWADSTMAKTFNGSKIVIDDRGC